MGDDNKGVRELERIYFLLELLELEYMLQPVRVMVVKESGKVLIDGVELELRRGTELEIPYWLAEVLEENKAVNIIKTPLALKDIGRVHFSTINTRSLAELEQLPKFFYREVRTYLENLDKKIREVPEPQLIDEKKKAEHYLYDIIDRRLLLLLNAIRSPTTITELSSKLSQEEVILWELLYRVVELWKKKVLSKS